MIELLILYILTRREFTMYGISKEIESKFGAYTMPSFGALKPALRRLETGGFLTFRKMMSDGGKLSVYYSITKNGEKELKNLMLDKISVNPVQFITNAKIKLACSACLNREERSEFYLNVKTSVLEIKNKAEKILTDDYTPKDFYQKILLDNTIVEYSNLLHIIEGFEKDNERNS